MKSHRRMRSVSLIPKPIAVFKLGHKFQKSMAGSAYRNSYKKIFDDLKEHNKWFENSIPLIASENVPSPAVKEALLSDFGNRYAEGWPGERVYAGCVYIDKVEVQCMDLAKKLYHAKKSTHKIVVVH